MKVVNFYYNCRPNEQENLADMHTEQQRLTERASVNNPKHFIIAEACNINGGVA